MESIRGITSFSHSGINHMWYPFSSELGDNFAVISTETYYQLHDFFAILQSMFATNNHYPDIARDENISDSQRYLTGYKKRTECSVIFTTDANSYKLSRCFWGKYSIEARLQKIGSNIVYHGQNVIQMLSRFHKPFFINETTLYNNKSMIFRPDSDLSRSSMAAMVNNWTKMVGIRDFRIELDYAGNWTSLVNDDSNFSHYRTSRYNEKPLIPPPIRILTHLAQAVMRKRTFGSCPPMLSPFNIENLNEFEAIAMLDLIKNVSIEEGLQFIVGINAKSHINSMVNAIETPKLSIYSS